MYVCMYVCMYVFMYVCMYVYMYVCISVIAWQTMVCAIFHLLPIILKCQWAVLSKFNIAISVSVGHFSVEWVYGPWSLPSYNTDVCVCVYVCMYVYMYVCMHVCVHIYV